MTALEVYEGSNGDATKALYAKLETFGPIGVIAMNLFRGSEGERSGEEVLEEIQGRGIREEELVAPVTVRRAGRERERARRRLGMAPGRRGRLPLLGSLRRSPDRTSELPLRDRSERSTVLEAVGFDDRLRDADHPVRRLDPALKLFALYKGREITDKLPNGTNDMNNTITITRQPDGNYKVDGPDLHLISDRPNFVAEMIRLRLLADQQPGTWEENLTSTSKAALTRLRALKIKPEFEREAIELLHDETPKGLAHVVAIRGLADVIEDLPKSVASSWFQPSDDQFAGWARQALSRLRELKIKPESERDAIEALSNIPLREHLDWIENAREEHREWFQPGEKVIDGLTPPNAFEQPNKFSAGSILLRLRALGIKTEFLQEALNLIQLSGPDKCDELLRELPMTIHPEWFDQNKPPVRTESIRIEVPTTTVPEVAPEPEALPIPRLNALTLQKDENGDFVFTGPNHYSVIPVAEAMKGDTLYERFLAIVSQLKSERDDDCDFTPIPARLQNQAERIAEYQNREADRAKRLEDGHDSKTHLPKMTFAEDLLPPEASAAERQYARTLLARATLDRWERYTGEGIPTPNNPLVVEFGHGRILIGMCRWKSGAAGVYFVESPVPFEIGDLPKIARTKPPGFIYLKFMNKSSARTLIESIELAREMIGGGFAKPPSFDVKELTSFVAGKIGEASMCWKPRPEGVFDSTDAKRISEEIVDNFLGATRGLNSELFGQELELATLRRDVAIAREETEKFRTAARVMCGLHIGQPQENCPVCGFLKLESQMMGIEEALAKAEGPISSGLQMCSATYRIERLGERIVDAKKEATAEIERRTKYGAIFSRMREFVIGEGPTEMFRWSDAVKRSDRRVAETWIHYLADLWNEMRKTAAELTRYKAGNLTPEELQELCHNMAGKVDADAFCAGCEDYQIKLFGRSPTKERREKLVEEAGQLRTGLRHWHDFVETLGVRLGCDPIDTVILEKVSELVRHPLDRVSKPEPHDRCSVCDWTNVGLLNLGEPNAAKWICHACIKRESDSAEKIARAIAKLGAIASPEHASCTIEHWIQLIEQALGERKTSEATIQMLINFAERGWIILASAWDGDWPKTGDWNEAASKYRDEFHEVIAKLLPLNDPLRSYRKPAMDAFRGLMGEQWSPNINAIAKEALALYGETF